MKYVKKLRMSRPYFELRPASELIEQDSARNVRQSAARGERYAFAYSPYGIPVRVYLDRLGNTPVKVSWFNPRNGECEVFGILPPEECVVVPPSTGKGNDWVLIDEQAVRDDLHRTMEAAKRYDVPLEMILKDISTVRNDPARLWR